MSLSNISAQEDKGRYVTLSGMVMQTDSLIPIPYTHVFLRNSRIGVRADDLGLFSIRIKPLDTVAFSAIGYKMTYFIFPDTLSENSYSIIQRLPPDTVSLKTVYISSWPSLEEFNRAFTREYNISENSGRAISNANPKLMEQHFIPNENDATINFRMENMREGNRLSNIYQNSHIPVRNVLNPSRWSKLIEEWERVK